MSNCSLCPALCQSRSKIVAPTPCPKNGLLAIGEAPGADEDRIGEGFVGRAGKTLDALMLEHGIERHHYGRGNLVRCRPADNRKPTRIEIEACLPKLAELLLSTTPRVIVTVGALPTAALLGGGSLSAKIAEAKANDGWPNPAAAHPALRDALGQFPVRIYPTVHTSPLSWNRNSPDGTKWSIIGRQQIACAVRALNGGLSK